MTTPTLAFASDTGLYSSDAVTNAGTVNVAGLEAGASWQYSLDAGQSWTTGTGSSFTLPANTYANGAVIARQTDVSGITSANGILYAGFASLASQRAAGMSGALDDTGIIQLKLSGGGFVQVWTGATSDGRSMDVFLKRFAADGSAIAGSEKRLSGVPNSTWDAAASLIELSGGKFVLAWGSGGSVSLQMYNADWTTSGSVLTSANLITNPNGISDISLAALADGGFGLAYSGSSNSPADTAIHVRKYDAQGNAGAITLLGDTGAGFPDQNSKISVDATGFSVTWRGRGSGFDELYVQDFLASGATSGARIKLPSSSGVFIPAIVKLPDGDWVHAVSRTGTYHNDIHVTRYSSAGALETTTQLFGTTQNTLADGYDSSPQVCLLSDGGYVVAWTGKNLVNSVGQDYDIWAQKFAADGSLVGAKTYMSGITGGYTDDAFTVTALSDGRYVVAWAGRTGSNGAEKDIFFQVFNTTGARLGAQQQLGTPLLYSDSNPKVTALSNGNFVIGWEGQTTDSQGIDVFSRIYSPGNIVVDTSTPTATLVSSGNVDSAGNVVVQSTEAGIAYLVHSSVTVTDAASITGAADHLWNQVVISTINTDTNLALTGLLSGTYRLYTTDYANLSTVSGNTVTVFDPKALWTVAQGSGGFVVNGQSAGDLSGFSVSSAGDVNGDGLDDLIVGAYANDSDSSNAGRSYVIFGKSGTLAVELSSLGSDGFVIKGPGANYRSGTSVSSAGDVNGDGFDDLIIGAPANEWINTPSASGRSYVVFGKTDSNPVDLSSLGNGGFLIQSTSADALGAAVSAAGDINGDGLDDVIIGAPMQDSGSYYDAGRSYVIYGKTGIGTVNLGSLGTQGFVITAEDENYAYAGTGVSSAGDVNNDGLADLLIGAYSKSSGGASDGGRVYVLFGKVNPTAINLSSIGTDGFYVDMTVGYGGGLGTNLSHAGDFNGDGLGDVVASTGSNSFLIFGKTSNATVSLPTGGVGIYGATTATAAGDINGDGLADLLVGNKGSNPTSGTAAGRSYVLFGSTNPGANIFLDNLPQSGSYGFRLDGQAAGDASGTSVSAAGDVNGDGLADLIVGAPNSDPATGADAGRSYVIFGSTSGIGSSMTFDAVGTTGADSLSDSGVASTLAANAGDDVLTATAASVLYGGSGDDTFNINGNMITALQSGFGSGGNTNQLARIDGGGGKDTISLTGTGLTLDLTLVANQAGGNVDGGSRIDSVEKINLTGTGSNTLILKVGDVLDMSSANVFAPTGRQQLMVIGDAGDQVDLADGSGTTGWALQGNVTLNGSPYAVWNHDTVLATLYVSTLITVG